MKKIVLLSTNLLLLLLLCACSSETIKSPDVVESTYSTSDSSSNDSEDNNETWNDDQDCSSATESYKGYSTKDHDWGEDYNSKGEYKPVEDMTQEEIKKELEEMMSDALGME
ncbi:hypothetical protein NH621_08700 [Lactococcus formosensis]|uniref:hypothetical protein n=1 Tax=Lactococcus formosensis TaxID=1281486 RepID=UPI00209690D1|nr:hypothetical protein [Lactococcus formosensis]MCO7181256.1 hypothetical protein [Lactococcus formosensis]